MYKAPNKYLFKKKKAFRYYFSIKINRIKVFSISNCFHLGTIEL